MIDTVTEGMNVLKLIGEPNVKLLKVMDLPNRGRGYVATQDIEAGTLIHVSNPFAMVVNQEWMPETCMGCFDFSYPKRMKIKALSTTEETRTLLQWWRQQQQQQQTGTKNDNNKLNNIPVLSPLRHIAFCTEQCKQDYISTCTNDDEWHTWLTCMYRLETYDPQQQQQQQRQQHDKATLIASWDDIEDPTTILHDDIALRNYLDKMWHLAWGSQNDDDDDDDADQDDFDETNRTMCRFIASCLVKRQNNNNNNNSGSSNNDLGFDSLWTMQDNELGHFRHFYLQQQQHHIMTPPSTPPPSQPLSSSSTSTCTSTSSITSMSTISDNSTTPSSILSSPPQHTAAKKIPTVIKQTIQLYRHFVSAMTQPMTLNTKGITLPIPPALPQEHLTSELFRAIYYREMANSFGLWEQPPRQKGITTNNMDAATMVTDDLELLGFGVYPSAVYFNHSCQANAVKLRNQSKMQFYTRQHVRQGDEVCISYGNVDAPLMERQERLLDHYYFTCACTRCRLEQQSLLD